MLEKKGRSSPCSSKNRRSPIASRCPSPLRARPRAPQLLGDVQVPHSFEDVEVVVRDKPTVWVSIKMHDVTQLDFSEQRFGAFFELDLKYDVSEMLSVVQPTFFGMNSEESPMQAAECKFPWIITNMIECDIVRENHFFKVVRPGVANEEDELHGPPVSIFGGCEQVRSSWPCPELGGEAIGKGGQSAPATRAYKCEQYVMRGIFKLYTVEYLWPFTGAWFMIKLATDERPGAELLQILPHHSDSSYSAFEAANIFGFVPARRREGSTLVPAVNYTAMHSQEGYSSRSSSCCSLEKDRDRVVGTFPKMYMVQAARRSNALEDWLKFYLMPFLSNIFVIQYEFQEPDNFVSILATLILAYIALLFTLPATASLAFAEQNVLMNMILLLISGYMSYGYEFDHKTIAYGNCGALFAVTLGQWLWSRYTNRLVDRAVESSDWKAIASYL